MDSTMLSNTHSTIDEGQHSKSGETRKKKVTRDSSSTSDEAMVRLLGRGVRLLMFKMRVPLKAGFAISASFKHDDEGPPIF